MSFKPHTREGYAHDHRAGIKSVEGVTDATIVDHDEEWLVATFEFETHPSYDAQDVFDDIVDWFTSKAHRPSFTGLGGTTDQFDDHWGRFPVHYPRK